MTTCPETDCPFITLSGWCGLTACIRRHTTTQINANPVIVIPDGYVQVVRCRDCKYGNLRFDADGHGLIQCTNTNYPAANVETWPFDLDWYCAGGERRDKDAAD